MGQPLSRDSLPYYVFYSEVLHANYLGDDAGATLVRDASGGALPSAGFFTPGHLVASFPDLIAPAAGASSMLDYLGGSVGSAAVSFPAGASGPVVYFAFPFETIDTAADRQAIMAEVLTRLSVN